MVVGDVETYSSERPVRVTPLVSTAVAVSGCLLFWLTTTGLVGVPEPALPGAASVIAPAGR